MKRRLVLAASAVLALSACGGEPSQVQDQFPRNYAETEVTLQDGRTITCLTWKSGYAGGLDCDWDNAR